jgi:peptide chain release factor 2
LQNERKLIHQWISTLSPPAGIHTAHPVSELTAAIEELQAKLVRFAKTVDADNKRRAITELEERMGGPTFWDDPNKAQGVVTQLKGLKAVVEPYTELSRRAGDLKDLVELAEGEGDEDMVAEARSDLERLAVDYESLEIKLALSGKYDNSAVYMTIKPGAGGVEACDWAGMIFRMYSQYCPVKKRA